MKEEGIILKTLFSILLIVTIMLSFNMNVYAQDKILRVDNYEDAFNLIIEEFDVDMTYLPVDESKISLNDYIKITREVAEEQRELLDYIEFRQSNNFELFSPLTMSIDSVTVTKTRTKDAWGDMGTYFGIKATYNVTGTQVSYLRNSSISYKYATVTSNVSLGNISNPTYSYLDGGRTGAVKYTAEMYYDFFWSAGNVTIYTEFYYSE